MTQTTPMAADETTSQQRRTNEKEEEEEEMAPMRRSTTQQDFSGGGMRAPKRVNTAPVEGSSSSKNRLRTMRTNTSLGMNLQQQQQRPRYGRKNTFEYRFEEAGRMSESDSSSSDEGEQEEDDKTQEKRQQEQADEGEEDKKEGAANNKRYNSSRFTIGNDLFKTRGRISKRDGRLKISMNETANSGYVAKALGQSIRNHLDIPHKQKQHGDVVEDHRHNQKKTAKGQEDEDESMASSLYTSSKRPSLNIVIMVIGSRGDIQPFLKIGQILRHEYGHRVRVASHPVFRDFVENESGLEFFSVGGDPSELMAFMVKNPGLIPSMQTVREGEIARRRKAMAEMFEGFWRACINTTDDEKDTANLRLLGEKSPFVADAIISNPPSMAHVHIAEKLGIPLHMMFTFPYSPTTQFPHPLANIKPRKSNVDANYVNFMSYPLVEMMTWQGLGDIVNRFRENTLRLEPVSSLWAPGALYRMKVPYTYLWSPSLVPKPSDWGPEIDIGGFVFLELASSFEPPQDLSDFLDAGEPPVYIGFGSIVVDDPDKFTEMIFKAVEIAGVRALVNKGWGGIGQSNDELPKNIFMLENTPHDWLFPRTKAVVHHGGAGTTAIGLKSAKPTMIVPFFGDQPFWGAMVADAKAGAHECIPYKKLNAERLAEGIKQCLTEEAQENVQKIADSMAKEGDGSENAVKSFHRSLPLAGRRSMRCSILQDRVAVWQVRKSSLRLSALAAEILFRQDKIKWNQLKLIRHHEWNDFDGPGEPFTGGVGALTDSLYGISEGFGMVPVRIARRIRDREEHERKKRARKRRREERAKRKADQAADTKYEKDGANNIPDSRDAGEGTERPPAQRQDTATTVGSTMSTAPPEPLPLEVVEDLHWGLKRAGAAVLTMPNDFHVAIAQGLHNAPRLWGDATVRKPVKITGVKSGFTAARKEFAYGVYDGWTGLVKQPKGDWQDGETVPAKFAGLGTGIGKGLGGLVLKNTNAVFAPPAFVGKGFIKWAEKKYEGQSSKAFLRKARIVTGQREYQKLQEPDGEEGGVREAQELVEHGWGVYERLWSEANKVTGNMMGKYRMRKEIKYWDANGALENVNTADRAFQARKDGKDLERYFEKRRQEMREAERPRAPAMEQPERFEESDRVLPNGRKVQDALPRQDESQSGDVALAQVPEGGMSETTPQDDVKGGAGKSTTVGKQTLQNGSVNVA